MKPEDHTLQYIKEEGKPSRPLLDAALSQYLIDTNITLAQLAEAYSIPIGSLQGVATRDGWGRLRLERQTEEKRLAVSRRIKRGDAVIEVLRRAERSRAARLAKAIDRRLKLDEDAFKDGRQVIGEDARSGKPILNPDILTAGDLCKLTSSAEAIQRILYRSHNLATEHTQHDVFQHFPQDAAAIDARYRVTDAGRELQARATDAETIPTPDGFLRSVIGGLIEAGSVDGADAAGLAADAAAAGSEDTAGSEAARLDLAGSEAGHSVIDSTPYEVPASIPVAENTGGVGGKYSIAIEQPAPSGANVIFQKSDNEAGPDEMESENGVSNEELAGWIRGGKYRADRGGEAETAGSGERGVGGTPGEGSGGEDRGGVPEGNEGELFEGGACEDSDVAE